MVLFKKLLNLELDYKFNLITKEDYNKKLKQIRNQIREPSCRKERRYTQRQYGYDLCDMYESIGKAIMGYY